MLLRSAVKHYQFPAGILQPPYFEKAMDDSVNYGAIGMFIGHELTAWLRRSGTQIDAQGNLRDWWTAEDANNTTSAASAFLTSNTRMSRWGPGVRQNGLLTQGEDTADNAASIWR